MADMFRQVVTETQPESVKPLPSGKSGALVATYRGGLRAVIKPVKETMPSGKPRQRGIAVRTHPFRECAYYQLAKLVGFDHLVPETVMIEHEGVKASAQAFLPAMHLRDLNPKLKDVHARGWRRGVVKTAAKVPRRFWRQLVALDLIAGSRDRHANNVGIQMVLHEEKPAYRLVAWDNAVTFGLTFAKYHNVFHKFMFRTALDFEDVWPALDKLTQDDFIVALAEYLTAQEIEHAWLRLVFIRDAFPYRLPWTLCSGGSDEADGFPAYASFFDTDEKPSILSA